MARRILRGAEQVPDPGVPVPALPLEQKATARANATVIQAGRDVITGNVFAGRFARLRDVWLDPAPVFEEVGVDRFVGREWLVESVDQFLRSSDRGYVVVQAHAGLGKTAFAAWLARSRDWPCHFTRRRKGRVATTALRNLAAQLVARYGLGEQFAPSGMLPETAGEPGWFDQVLRAAAEVARAAGDRLVLVVDGLDEAEHVDGDLPLGLPAALPAGVFVVATCRNGTDLPALRQPWKQLAIHAEDKRNTADLQRFLHAAVAEEPLATLLASHHTSVKGFVRQLIQRCGGVWVYLRYVLDELRYGLRSPADLDQLPTDLASYYIESLVPFEAEPTWVRTRLPLLATLAAVAEPLPIDALTRLAGLSDPASVRALCRGRLRPFLVELTDDHGGSRYGIYHVSLREFLSGATLRHAMDSVRSRAEELVHATREAHARIAHHYLAVFGGLDTQLAELAADPALAARDGGYPLRYLAYHLDRADRVEDLHQLLVCEQPTGPDSARNVWFDVHDHAGSLDDYLADIRRARRRVEQHTNTQVDNGQQAPSLGLEIRYVVITAAVTTLTANVPVPLLLRLVTTGLWTATRATNHARYLHDPLTRARAFTVLLAHLPNHDKAAVAAEALAAANAIVDNDYRAGALLELSCHLSGRRRTQALADAFAAVRTSIHENHRAWALGQLVPDLPQQLLPAVLAAAGVINDERHRVWALMRLLPHLPEPLLATVLTLAREITGGYNRARVLTALAPRLPDQLLVDALAIARGITDPGDRAWTLGKLALRMPESREQLLAEALAVARTDTDQGNQIWALGTLMQHLSEMQREKVLADALTTARGIIDPGYRAWALSTLALCVPEPQREQIMTQALAAIGVIVDDEDRARHLGYLASDLPDSLLGKALTMVRGIANEYYRIRALSDVAAHLPEPEGEQVLAEALAAVGAITDEHSRTDALGYLAPHLPDSLLAEALTMADDIIIEHYRIRVLGRIAPRLTKQLLGEALKAARTITDDRGRARLLGELSQHLPEPQRKLLVTEALNITRATTIDYNRGTVLKELASRLTEPQRGQVLTEGLTAARAIADHDNRAEALSGLAPHLPEPQRGEVLAEALTAARAISTARRRAVTLGWLASCLSEPQRGQVLTEALTAARAITTEYVKVSYLAMLAGALPNPQRRQVITEVLDIARALPSDAGPVARALVKLARYLPERFLTEALTAAYDAVAAINDLDLGRSEAVGELAKYVRHVPARLLSEALIATRALPIEFNATFLLGGLALHLPEPQREQVLAEALTAARWTTFARCAALTQAAALWGPKVGSHELELLRRFLDAPGLDDCFSVLAAAVPILRNVGGAAMVESCLDAIRAVQRWWQAPSTNA